MMKTIHHIDSKRGDTFSFNCPVCGTSQMTADIDSTMYWTCGNGHEFFISLYQSHAGTLNLSIVQTIKAGGQHG
jgi:hypothetical protein